MVSYEFKKIFQKKNNNFFLSSPKLKYRERKALSSVEPISKITVLASSENKETNTRKGSGDLYQASGVVGVEAPRTRPHDQCTVR